MIMRQVKSHKKETYKIRTTQDNNPKTQIIKEEITDKPTIGIGHVKISLETVTSK